jgi:hypothetical protein
MPQILKLTMVLEPADIHRRYSEEGSRIRGQDGDMLVESQYNKVKITILILLCQKM